jgi:hypothetical protein
MNSSTLRLSLPNKHGTNADGSVPSEVHVRLAVVGSRNAAARITASVFKLFVATLGREGPFEGYCSEGIERYKFRTRVIVGQRNSRELSF